MPLHRGAGPGRWTLRGSDVPPAAVGVATAQAGCSVRKRWPWAFVVCVNCPSCERSRLVCEVIVHLNDDHRWDRLHERGFCAVFGFTLCPSQIIGEFVEALLGSERRAIKSIHIEVG